MERIPVNNWLTVALFMLCALYPMQLSRDVLAIASPLNAVAAYNQPLAIEPVSPRVVKSNGLNAPSRSYTYTFTGLATFKGQPMTNVRVEIRVTSEYAADIHEVTTGPDGRYTLSVPITGKASETLSWEIRGVTSNLKQTNWEGHQILTDEHAVQMVTPLVFSEI